MKRIYLSGPITGVPDYLERFEEAETKVQLMGYAPINPAKMNHCIPDMASFSHEEYMSICLELLRHVDGIYMMKGWENSKGAKMELTQVLERHQEYMILSE